MLPKARRLTTKEVHEVLAKGRARRASYLSVKYVATNEPLKTSVVVAKSVAKGAVERNRLRRAVYRALTPHHGRGKMLVFVQKIPQNSPQAVFKVELENLCTQL